MYVGETSRALADRIREHRGLTHKIQKNIIDFGSLERISALAFHAIEHSHSIKFEQPEILSMNWHIYRGRIAAEQWYINNENNGMQCLATVTTSGLKSAITPYFMTHSCKTL